MLLESLTQWYRLKQRVKNSGKVPNDGSMNGTSQQIINSLTHITNEQKKQVSNRRPKQT